MEDESNERHHRHNDDDNMNSIRVNVPKFYGTSDPEAYLSWALKVDKIFRVHNYSQEKMVATASLEFEDYALLWWDQVQVHRVSNNVRQITTWREMKE